MSYKWDVNQLFLKISPLMSISPTKTLCLCKVLKQVEKENCIFIHVFHIITASLNQGCKTTRSIKTESAIGKFFACPFSSRSGHFLSPPWCLIKEYNHQKAPFGKRCLILLYLMMPTGCNDSQMSPAHSLYFPSLCPSLCFPRDPWDTDESWVHCIFYR